MTILQQDFPISQTLATDPESPGILPPTLTILLVPTLCVDKAVVDAPASCVVGTQSAKGIVPTRSIGTMGLKGISARRNEGILGEMYQ